jgi:arylformamidase
MDLEAGDPVTVTHLAVDVHAGTHVDAPAHYLRGGATVESLPLEALIGPAWVADFPGADAIDAAALAAARIPEGTRRLLLRTRNSGLWGRGEHFHPDFVALTLDAARWIVDRGILLVGNDYLSVQRYWDGPETHMVLLRQGVVLLEGIDLARVEPGSWELICLPLLLPGADGAPARAVLRREEAP